MNLTFKQLRNIKHQLPTGSISRIATQLQLEEQTVRNFFGAKKQEGERASWSFEQGPEGGIMSIQDTSILDAAQKILKETNAGQRNPGNS